MASPPKADAAPRMTSSGVALSRSMVRRMVLREWSTTVQPAGSTPSTVPASVSLPFV